MSFLNKFLKKSEKKVEEINEPSGMGSFHSADNSSKPTLGVIEVRTGESVKEIIEKITNELKNLQLTNIGALIVVALKVHSVNKLFQDKSILQRVISAGVAAWAIQGIVATDRGMTKLSNDFIVKTMSIVGENAVKLGGIIIISKKDAQELRTSLLLKDKMDVKVEEMQKVIGELEKRKAEALFAMIVSEDKSLRGDDIQLDPRFK